MRRALTTAALVAVAAALPAGAQGPASPGVPRLYAKVTAKSISFTDAQGARVREAQTNTYRIFVGDATRAQNFHLIGPDVDRKTRVAGKAQAAWLLTLMPGTYVYRSDRSKKLRGSFVVKKPPPA